MSTSKLTDAEHETLTEALNIIDDQRIHHEHILRTEGGSGHAMYITRLELVLEALRALMARH